MNDIKVVKCPKCQSFVSLKTKICKKCGFDGTNTTEPEYWIDKKERLETSLYEIKVDFSKFPRPLKFFRQIAKARNMSLSDVIASYAIVGTSVDMDKLRQKKIEKDLEEIQFETKRREKEKFWSDGWGNEKG